jgi:hypothetical protein
LISFGINWEMMMLKPHETLRNGVVAVQVTRVVPSGNLDPDCGLQVTGDPSLATGVR